MLESPPCCWLGLSSYYYGPRGPLLSASLSAIIVLAFSNQWEAAKKVPNHFVAAEESRWYQACLCCTVFEVKIQIPTLFTVFMQAFIYSLKVV